MIICPECGARNSVDARFCSNCGASLVQNGRYEVMPSPEHTGLGVASLILGIIAIITFFIPIFIFGILALVFGAVSYWGQRKDSFGRVGFILGLSSVILNIIIWIWIIFVAWLLSS